MTLIDFSKPSTEKRLYVLDMKNKKLLYTSVVSHGKNSGGNYATSFSNKNGSYKSSLGFYLTENTYQGRNGYSLVLNGLEKGINDQAKQRAIVMHGAAYANPKHHRFCRTLGTEPRMPPPCRKHSPNRLSTQSKKEVCSLSTPTTRTIWPTAPSCLHGKRSIFMGAACQLKILSYLCGKGIFILTKTIMKKFTCVQDIGDLKSALPNHSRSRKTGSNM